MPDFDFFTSGSKNGNEGKDAVDAFLSSGEASQLIERDDHASAKSLRASCANYIKSLDDGWRVQLRQNGNTVGLMLVTHESVTDAVLTTVFAKGAAGSVVGQERAAGAAFEQEDRDKIQAEWIEKRIQMVKDYRDAHQGDAAA